MRRKIVAGNWKMNNDLSQTDTLLEQLKKQEIPRDVTVMVSPSFTNLQQASASLKQHDITVAAQNMHQAANGAFTGEVSAAMLKGVGVDTVILGHSERRAYFGETNALLSEKINTALENDMHVIYCFGEELVDRKNGSHFDIVKQQLTEGIFHIAQEGWKNVILAYEPVWAIGTGETASPDQAQEMHAFVRTCLREAYDSDTASGVSILYGGSVKPANASEIFGKEDVDGGLIGGAALDAANFMAIVNAF